MPDEGDESEEGEPVDGSEEPRERPDADDPERGSPIDTSDLEAQDTTDDDSEPGVDLDDGDDTDEGREEKDTGVESDTGTDEEVADETDDSDVTAGADETLDDGDDPAADDGDTTVDASAVDGAEETDEDDADDADEEETDGADDGEFDAGADEADDPGVEAEADDGPDGVGDDADDDGEEIDDGVGEDGGTADLDDWPSVKPDPVDLDSPDEERESAGDDGSGPAAGSDDSEVDAGETEEADADDASEEPAEDRERSDGVESESEGDVAGDDADLPEAQTDGEGYVRDQPGAGGSGYDGGDDLGGISTPPDDEEMPLADHIEEMILRLAAVLLVGAAGTAIGLLGASPAIDFIWQNVLPANLDAPPHVYHPLELWLTRIKVAALLGILVALPMFVYQCYLFMRPGLYPNERKYYLSAVPMSLVLAVVGMFISFVLVLPILFRYFTFYSEGSAGIAYALGETFNLIITLTGFLAIVFQIPLFIMLAIMLGVTTRQWLVDKRLYFWAAFFGLSFMFTMDPTLMAPIIVGIIMIVLFEGTLLLLKWTGQE